MTIASKTTLASFFLNFLFFSSIYAQCPIGNVFLTTQADVDNYMNFYHGCTAIDGAVYLGSFTTTPSDIRDLSGFENLVTIKDGLFISNAQHLENLNGFQSLKNAGPTISLFFNEKLADVDDLIGVSNAVEELFIVDNRSLQNVEGLINVKLAKNITINDNQSLHSLHGLTTFSDLQYITIQNNDQLTDLAGLQWAQYLIQLKIIDNAILTNVNGLDNITSVTKDLVLSNNPLLSDLSGLNQLASVGQNLSIVNSPALASLAGLEDLIQSTQIILKDNDGLNTISALNNLNTADGITILNNPILSSLNGLSNVNDLARLVIAENDALINLNGLSGLNSITDYLRISDQLNLTTLAGLDNLSSAAGVVEIKDNAQLADINAIDGTNLTATSLEISTNPLLKVCNVTSVCNYLLSNIGLSAIYDNDLGCKSVPAVQAACGLILAVELSDFAVMQVGGLAVINWQTQAEKNNLGFEIQRSIDGIHWNMIGWVASTAAGEKYSFIDKYPQAGTNYYRLMQTDYDGEKNSSDIRQLNFKTADLVGISIYPNPASDKITLEIPTTKNIKWDQISLYDLRGKLLRQWPIETTQKTYLLNLQGLPSGFYMMRVGDQQQKLYVDDIF